MKEMGRLKGDIILLCFFSSIKNLLEKKLRSNSIFFSSINHALFNGALKGRKSNLRKKKNIYSSKLSFLKRVILFFESNLSPPLLLHTLGTQRNMIIRYNLI